MNKLAQINIAPNNGFRGFGKLGLEGDTAANSANIFQSFLSTVIGVITIVAFIWFTLSFMTGAVSILASGGDKQALEAAKKKITTGIIGLVVVVAGIFIVDLIGSIFGIKILAISDMISKLTTK